MYKAIWTLCCLWIGIGLAAQEAGLEGYIYQEGLETTIPGVNIYLRNTEIGTFSGSQGYFELEEIPAGKYTLVASAVGYTTLEKIIELQENETKEIDLHMVESVTDLPPVVVESVSLTGGLGGLKEMPGSAQYISPKELERFEHTDINRILAGVPGINIQEEDGFGLRPNIGLRGTGVERSSKITVMEDGVLAAPAPYAAPAAYYFPTIGRMQAIEILKGASQVKFGPYTTGGALNLISTQIPYEWRGAVNIMAGSYGYRNMHAYAGKSFKNVGFLVESYLDEATGFKELPGNGNTGFDKKDFIAKVRFNTGPKAKVYQSITFKIGQSYETSNETYLGLTDADFQENPLRRYAASQLDQMNTKHRLLQARYVIQPSRHINITTTVYRNDFHRNWYKLDKVKATDSTGTVKLGNLLENPLLYQEEMELLKGATGTHPDALFMKNNNREYYSQGIQTVANGYFKTGDWRHKVQVGVRYHQDAIDRFQWVDEYSMDDGTMKLTAEGTPGTESNRVETAYALALYGLYELKKGNWTVTPGLRYEHIILNRKDYGKNDVNRTGIELKERTNQVDVWIPGIGVNYDVNAYWNVFAGVHKGFAPPGSKEGTKPENSVNYELGTRYFRKALLGQLVVFYNDYDNLLGADLAAAGGSGSTDLFNGGQVKVMGVEAQLEYDLLSKKRSRFGIPVKISYTYTSARFDNHFESDYDPWGTVEVGDELPYVAPHQFSGMIGLNHTKFGLFATAKCMASMRTIAGQGELDPSESTDGYLVFDLSAEYQPVSNLSIFATALNMTDEVYIVARRPAGVRPGLPRMFKLGVKAKF